MGALYWVLEHQELSAGLGYTARRWPPWSGEGLGRSCLTSFVCPTPGWYDFCLNSQSGYTVLAYGNAPSAHDKRGRAPGLLHLVWPACVEARAGGRLVQRPTRCVASRAQAAPQWSPTSPLTLRGKPHAALTTRGVCHNESSHRGGLW
jgi:hypothetical protein